VTCLSVVGNRAAFFYEFGRAEPSLSRAEEFRSTSKKTAGCGTVHDARP
jgi:hypothetical protein